MRRQSDKEMEGMAVLQCCFCAFACLLPCLLLLSSCIPAATATLIPAGALAPTGRCPTYTPRSGRDADPYGTMPAPTLTSTSLPPTHTPTATTTLTPAPTLDPATVAVTVAKVRARLAEASIEPLCLRWEDTDGDGEAEWVGLYHQPGEPPRSGVGPYGTMPRLAAFVLDGDAWHDLRPLEKEPGEGFGLGEYLTCELEVRDVNADGRVEILVWGHAATSIDLLHIFVWDGTTYTLLAPFEGKAGVRLENSDGDLADEVVVGYDAGSGLAWEAVYTWDGANYGWTWERYTWFYLDRPHVYPTDTAEHAVVSFYLAIDDRDLPGAYSLLSLETQAAQPAEGWMLGFVTTVAVEAGAVYEISRSGPSENIATVVAQVRAYDNVDGRIIATLWDVEWTVIRTDAGWRLEEATADQLDSWELPYYPLTTKR